MRLRSHEPLTFVLTGDGQWPPVGLSPIFARSGLRAQAEIQQDGTLHIGVEGPSDHSFAYWVECPDPSLRPDDSGELRYGVHVNVWWTEDGTVELYLQGELVHASEPIEGPQNRKDS